MYKLTYTNTSEATVYTQMQTNQKLISRRCRYCSSTVKANQSRILRAAPNFYSISTEAQRCWNVHTRMYVHKHIICMLKHANDFYMLNSENVLVNLLHSFGICIIGRCLSISKIPVTLLHWHTISIIAQFHKKNKKNKKLKKKKLKIHTFCIVSKKIQ